MTINVTSPNGTSGVLALPSCNGVVSKVVVDGKTSKTVSGVKLSGGGTRVVKVTFE